MTLDYRKGIWQRHSMEDPNAYQTLPHEGLGREREFLSAFDLPLVWQQSFHLIFSQATIHTYVIHDKLGAQHYGGG